MPITRKTPAQIQLMRRAGQVVAEMHARCAEFAKPGVTTAELDAVAREVLDERGARSNFLGYHGTFPAVICTSPNDMIVHGIPDGYVLKEGDILSIDCGAIIEGWHGDAAVTLPIGEIDKQSERLLTLTTRALNLAIEQMIVGNRLGDVGAAIEDLANAESLGLVRNYGSHGIGTAMHEEPWVANYGPAKTGLKLKEGMVFAIEPMLTLGSAENRVLDDGWSVVTQDGSRAAHFEHTIAITANGPEILTIP